MKLLAFMDNGSVRRRPWWTLVQSSVLLPGLVLAGCAGKPQASVAPLPVAATVPPTPAVAPEELGPRARLARALERLGAGQAAAARNDLNAILALRPDDRVALDLIKQIDADPRLLLGQESYAYQIRAGETLSSIAGRLLGDPYRFWALARYNNIAVPASAEVGQMIQVPGRAPPPAAPVVAPPAPVVVEKPVEAPPVVRPRPTNPAAAARLRNQGLGAMARGSIDNAVRLLERALAFDPANAVILRDLGRARKIQQTVRTQ